MKIGLLNSRFKSAAENLVKPLMPIDPSLSYRANLGKNAKSGKTSKFFVLRRRWDWKKHCRRNKDFTWTKNTSKSSRSCHTFDDSTQRQLKIYSTSDMIINLMTKLHVVVSGHGVFRYSNWNSQTLSTVQKLQHQQVRDQFGNTMARCVFSEMMIAVCTCSSLIYQSQSINHNLSITIYQLQSINHNLSITIYQSQSINHNHQSQLSITIYQSQSINHNLQSQSINHNLSITIYLTIYQSQYHTRSIQAAGENTIPDRRPLASFWERNEGMLLASSSSVGHGSLLVFSSCRERKVTSS